MSAPDLFSGQHHGSAATRACLVDGGPDCTDACVASRLRDRSRRQQADETIRGDLAGTARAMAIDPLMEW
jgi:hypothetical protein